MAGNNRLGKDPRAVIDDNDLKGGPVKALTVEARQAGLQGLGLVKVRNDDRKYR